MLKNTWWKWCVQIFCIVFKGHSNDIHLEIVPDWKIFRTKINFWKRKNDESWMIGLAVCRLVTGSLTKFFWPKPIFSTYAKFKTPFWTTYTVFSMAPSSGIFKNIIISLFQLKYQALSCFLTQWVLKFAFRVMLQLF